MKARRHKGTKGRDNGIATWGVNYGVVAGLGLTVALALDCWMNLSLWSEIGFVFLPMPLLSTLIARHAKALFVAMDHYFDPHVKR